MVLANRIIANLNKAPIINDIQATVSIGIADAQAGEQSTEAVLQIADEHLYQAKKAGRNRAVSA